MANSQQQSLRVDKWLWAARFFKTRSLATAAVIGGKVQVNGERAKPAKTVQPGDTVRIRHGPLEWTVVVTALAERRGSAQVAATLYQEAPESTRAREARALQLRLHAPPTYEGKGRPTKKARREIDRLRDGD
jgi:ribosome-associated heat shock protein Hsp15